MKKTEWLNAIITGWTAWIWLWIAKVLIKAWINILVTYLNNEERADKDFK